MSYQVGYNQAYLEYDSTGTPINSLLPTFMAIFPFFKARKNRPCTATQLPIMMVLYMQTIPKIVVIYLAILRHHLHHIKYTSSGEIKGILTIINFMFKASLLEQV